MWSGLANCEQDALPRLDYSSSRVFAIQDGVTFSPADQRIDRRLNTLVAEGGCEVGQLQFC